MLIQSSIAGNVRSSSSVLLPKHHRFDRTSHRLLQLLSAFLQKSGESYATHESDDSPSISHQDSLQVLGSLPSIMS